MEAEGILIRLVFPIQSQPSRWRKHEKMEWFYYDAPRVAAITLNKKKHERIPKNKFIERTTRKRVNRQRR
jgi:hypothetical protein